MISNVLQLGIHQSMALEIQMLIIHNNHKKSIEFLDWNLLRRAEQVDGLVLFSRRQLASAKVPRVCKADVHRVKLAVAPHVMSLTSLKTKEIGLEQQKPMCMGVSKLLLSPILSFWKRN